MCIRDRTRAMNSEIEKSSAFMRNRMIPVIMAIEISMIRLSAMLVKMDLMAVSYTHLFFLSGDIAGTVLDHTLAHRSRGVGHDADHRKVLTGHLLNTGCLLYTSGEYARYEQTPSVKT